MSNETIDDIAGGINELAGSAGRIAAQQIEMISLAIESVTQLSVPVSETATDLVSGLLSGFNQVLEKVSSSLALKKQE
ncbi:MAG: chlorosome envelope protein B [Chlorobiaceae bacterium]|nr:chlorosome envelope protein B [Chlorobiaceae bacterium]